VGTGAAAAPAALFYAEGVVVLAYALAAAARAAITSAAGFSF
jgi:hypothetical protein